MSDRFIGVDILYDDKEWGNLIDPNEWNDNFLAIEEAFNDLVAELNSGVITDADKQVFVAIYGETTSFDLASAVQMGKICVVVYNNKPHYLMEVVSATKHIFYNSTYNPTTKLASLSKIICEEDGWSQANYDMPSNGYLSDNYATKIYVDNAIANIPGSLQVSVTDQRLIFTE